MRIFPLREALLGCILKEYYLKKVNKHVSKYRCDAIKMKCEHMFDSFVQRKRYKFTLENGITLHIKYTLVFSVCICFDGVVIATQCTATFEDLLCSLEFRYYQDVNMPFRFCSEAYFSGLRFFNEPEISDTGLPASGGLVLRIFTS